MTEPQSGNDLVKRVAIAGTLVALGAAGGILFLSLFGPKDGDEERPPIIVQNGSIRIDAEYPVKGSKGYWEDKPNNRWDHKHDEPGPSRTRVSVFNGTCDAQTSASWEDNLALTVTDGRTVWEVELLIVGNHMRVSAPGLKGTKTDSLLVLTPPDDYVPPADAPKPWVSKAAPLSGGNGCTFAKTDRPVIRLEQKQK